jgi:hypothetical protein
VLWADVCVHAIDDDRMKQFELDFARSDWSYNSSTLPLDVAVHAVRNPLLKAKNYMSMFNIVSEC